MFNILCDGRIIYRALSHEECSEILSELSERFYDSDEFILEHIEIEETYG